MSEFKGTVKLSTDRGINRGPSAVRFQLSFTDGQVTADVNIAMEGITITSDPKLSRSGNFQQGYRRVGLADKVGCYGFLDHSQFLADVSWQRAHDGKRNPSPSFLPQGYEDRCQRKYCTGWSNHDQWHGQPPRRRGSRAGGACRNDRRGALASTKVAIRLRTEAGEKSPHLINARCCYSDADRSSKQRHYSVLDRSFQSVRWRLRRHRLSAASGSNAKAIALTADRAYRFQNRQLRQRN